ncbi:MAG: hypothetical protein A2156_07610 [Deltaproteobacteria bacterium RBG_16_48_10]|nr:MAG: hypothetical protein A2156_07610 [Deltaproteobacteria bacterium RBG_16_48_10]
MDRLEIHLKGKKAESLSFLLHPDLKIKGIVNLKTGKPLRWAEASFSAHAKRVDISSKEIKVPLSISISYEGRIYDPIVKEKALQFVRGDQTSGLISEEGVYLSSSSHWYPDRPDSMAVFKVKARIPEPLRVVTQGELLSEEFKAGFWESKWSYSLPAESLTLVAGKYSIKTRDMDGIRVSTYFFPEDDRLSGVFLNAAEEYLRTYSGLLGPYPYKKYDIVQNFFSSGYSFPTFTLLSPEAIRQGKEFLRPGALDHEIVHSWWGHSVMFKPGTGNWVEALTSYCTNYFYKELRVGEEAARKHRREILQKYAIQVSPSKDYPLRKFEGKEDEVAGQIGYGKGSMVFHMLRMIVGKDLFFETLRRFAGQYKGKQASWDDIKEIFEKASGRNLNPFFSQWLDRPGGPRLKLGNMNHQNTPVGYQVSWEVVQGGDIYELLLPIEVDDGVEKRSLPFEVSKRRHLFSLVIPRLPWTLTIDPDAQIFRRLYPDEILPGLNAFLEDQEKIFILSEQGDEESRKIYRSLANMAMDRKGGKILTIKEVGEKEILNSSLMLFGESYKDPIFSKLLSNLPGPVCFQEGAFFLKGKKISEGDESLLLTYSHPFSPKRWITLYFGLSPMSLSRARFIFFYGWDSYILFKNGRPVERGVGLR